MGRHTVWLASILTRLPFTIFECSEKAALSWTRVLPVRYDSTVIHRLELPIGRLSREDLIAKQQQKSTILLPRLSLDTYSTRHSLDPWNILLSLPLVVRLLRYLITKVTSEFRHFPISRASRLGPTLLCASRRSHFDVRVEFSSILWARPLTTATWIDLQHLLGARLSKRI